MTSVFDVIGERLDINPPSLGAIMGLFMDPELRKEFGALLDEYLPDHKYEILAQGNSDGKYQAFKFYFEQRYFELADLADFGEEEDEVLWRLIQYCPIELYGFSTYNYDDVSHWQEGKQLMLSVITAPERDQDLIPYIEQAIKLRGDIARKLPLSGWSVEDLREITRNTIYEALGEFAEWVYSETGIGQLDANWDDGWDMQEWDRDEVEQMTRDARLIGARSERMNKLIRWLEESPDNYTEMVNFLLEHSDIPVKTQLEEKKPQTLMEVFSDDDKEETERIRPATRSDLVAATRF